MAVDPSTGQQVPDNANFTLPPDPVQLQGQVQTQQDALQASQPSSLARRSMQAQTGLAGGAGQDPRVLQAQQQQQQLKDILADVKAQAPENEDPLDLQARLSASIMAKMSDSNPQLALQASQRLVAIQEAKQQRSLLSTTMADTASQTSLRNAQAGAITRSSAIASATPVSRYYVDPKTFQPLGHVDITAPDGTVNDPMQISTQTKALEAKNPGGQWMNEAELSNGRLAAAQIGLQKDQADNWNRIMVAQIKANAAGAKVPASTMTAFHKDADGQLAMVNGLDQIADFIHQNPDSQSIAARAKNEYGQAASNLSSIFGSNDDESLYNKKSTAYGQFQGLAAPLAIALARGAIGSGQRLTNVEINKMDAVLGKSSNPQQLINNLGNQVDRAKQNWDDYVISHPDIANNPDLANSHAAIAQKLQALSDKLHTYGRGSAPVNGGGNSFASEADAQAARQANKIHNGDKITVGGKAATWRD